MRDTVLDRRENPKDDIISKLWKLEIDGEPMTLNVIESYCVVLFLGGLDTVVNALTLGVRHLAEHPELQAELRADPELIPGAVEEFLRCYAIVSPIRKVTAPTDFHGVQFNKGDMVMLFAPGAGYDASAYPDPHKFDPRRNGPTHLAFATGPHFCVGSSLARLELAIMYATILKRLPEFRIDPERPPTFHGGVVNGPTSLHLVWDV
jgi:cytochrome P450